jgi:hypothetical protein
MKTLTYFAIVDEDNVPIESQSMEGQSVMWATWDAASEVLSYCDGGERIVRVTIHIE